MMTGPTGLVARLRARIAARPDTELEQAIVRLMLGLLVLLYLVPDSFRNPEDRTLSLMLGYLAFSILIFVDILASNRISPTRRILAELADLGTITWCMASGGEHAAPLFLLYVW